MPMYRQVDTNFFKTWTPEMAYVLGFFAADGNMIKSKRGNCYIAFYSSDKDILHKIRRVLASAHKIAIHNRKNSQIENNRKNSYKIQIGSKEMYSDLLSRGMTPRKSLLMRLPKIAGINFPHFVRGYFDGDGCVYFRKHRVKGRKSARWIFSTRFTSGSKVFLEELHHALQKVVSGGFIINKNRGFELIFSHRDSLALYRFMYNNMSDSLYLSRKRKLFDRAIQTLYGSK